MRVWDLNPIVLAHLQRFFSAAWRALEAPSDDDLPTIGELAANLVWAKSSFVAKDLSQEQALSTAAALASTFASKLELGSIQRAAAVEALSELESELWSSLDPLLERMLAEIVAGGHEASSPAVIDRWIWERLFPGYPFGASQADLEGAIRSRMAR